jgi:hypothetical protein
VFFWFILLVFLVPTGYVGELNNAYYVYLRVIFLSYTVQLNQAHRSLVLTLLSILK